VEQPNDVGDLYLDVAEAFMEVGNYKSAKPILASLVHSDNYNLVSTLVCLWSSRPYINVIVGLISLVSFLLIT